VRPCPDRESPGVLSVQRRLLDVVKVASSGDGPLGNVLVPGVKWDALQVQTNAVLEVVDVAVRDQLPRPGVDVEIAIGETPLSHSLITGVTVLEVDEEVLGEVLGNGDILHIQ